MGEHEPDIRGLRREWLAARIAAALGGLMLIAILVVAGVSVWPVNAPEAGAPVNSSGTAALPPSDDTKRQEGIALCTAALSSAQNLGIVPNFATRASDDAQRSDVQGRYTCFAKTDAAKYTIAFDLVCTHLGDPNCIALFMVSQDDGGVLFQRH